MSESLYRRTFPPGSNIFSEGEVGDCAYVIESGTIEISALRQGKKMLLAELREGELFGEMALIDGQVRSATATARDEATLVMIHRHQVREKITKADPLLNLFLQVILDRLRSANSFITPKDQGVQKKEPLSVQHAAKYKKVHEKAMAALQLEGELKKAIENKEFELYYQPIIDMRGGHTAGFEALIRWHHPERGLVLPDDFIGLAEETGLIVPMGMWVMNEACNALMRIQNACREHSPYSSSLFMNVNVSARQLSYAHLDEGIRQIIRKSGIKPACLKLEITESLLMEDPEQAVEVLRKLKALGLKLVVDDFGTGYSSLSYLHRFPIDVIKIDKSFVQSMHKDDGILRIVRGITGLARELGLEIVAEGVEQMEELTLIRGFGCDYGQGYFFFKPLPEAEANKAARERASVHTDMGASE